MEVRFLRKRITGKREGEKKLPVGSIPVTHGGKQDGAIGRDEED